MEGDLGVCVKLRVVHGGVGLAVDGVQTGGGAGGGEGEEAGRCWAVGRAGL